MAITDPFAGKDVQVWFNSAQIACLVGYDASGLERDSIDGSSQQDTSDWRTFVPGKLNAGELTLSLRFNRNDSPVTRITSAIATLEIRFPDSTSGSGAGAKLSCSAFVMGVPFSGDQDGPGEQSLRFKLTGQPTWTAET